MKYLVWSIIPIAIYLLYYFIAGNNLKSVLANREKTQLDIHPPRLYTCIGVIGITFFTWLTVLSVLQDVSLWGIIISVFFEFLSFSIIWYSVVWRIKLDKTNRFIVFRNVFLQTYKITFDEFISYEEKANHCVIYTTKKKIEVDLYASNLVFLLSLIPKTNNSK